MTKLLSKEEAMKRLEESTSNYVMWSEYDECIGISTMPKMIEKEKGKSIVNKCQKDIPYSSNGFMKTLTANNEDRRSDVLTFL